MGLRMRSGFGRRHRLTLSVNWWPVILDCVREMSLWRDIRQKQVGNHLRANREGTRPGEADERDRGTHRLHGCVQKGGTRQGPRTGPNASGECTFPSPSFTIQSFGMCVLAL